MTNKSAFLIRFLALAVLLAVSCMLIFSGCANAPALDLMAGSIRLDLDSGSAPVQPTQIISSASANGNILPGGQSA